MPGIDQYIASANSFSDLGNLLRGDARAKLQVSELASTFEDQELGAAVVAIAGTSTFEAFSQRKDLHRALQQTWHYQGLLKAFKAALERRRGSASRPVALLEPECFADLIPDVEGHAFADMMMAQIVPQLAIPERIRRLVPGAVPLMTFLDTADERAWPDEGYLLVLDALASWITQQLALRPGAASLPRVSLADFNQRVEKTCIPDLLDWSLAMLEGGTDDLYYSPILGQLVRRSLPEADKHLTKFEARLAQLRSMRPILERPADPALAALYEAALAERNRFAPMYPFGLCAARSQLKYDPPHLEVWVSLPGITSPTRVTLPDFWRWARTTPVDCACRQRVCIHRVLVLESLLIWANEPKTAGLLLEALKPTWELVLDALSPGAEPKQKRGVLSFEVGHDSVDLGFHELGKRGPSSKRKTVAPADVLTKVDGLDQRIAERLALADAARSAESPHLGDGLLLLEGHPRVHWVGEAEPSPVARAVGTVKIDETDSGFRFKFIVEGQELERRLRTFRCTGGSLTFVRAADKRILIAFLSDRLLQLMGRTERLGTELPREAAPRLVELLPALEAGALVELPDDLRGEERPPAERTLVRVMPAASGLSLSIRVEPLERGPVFVPGQGVAVSAHFDGRRRSFTRRRFEAELNAANALAGMLGLDPTIAFEPYTWLLDGSDKHVETLRRLSVAGVPVEWTAPKVKFTSEAQLGRLRLNITRKKDWFGLEGEVTVDDRRVSLAALLEAARARRRFVKLGDGDFAQLSEAMVDSLAPLAHLNAEKAQPELTLGTAPLIEALAPQVEQLDAAKEWSALMTRLAEAKTTKFPVPKTLKATLRDYQVEGYEWLSRLAQWGVGACLADDMGLGKTLQALTLLLSRAKLGPALVVAPSSVIHNWSAEAAKFAPSLKIRFFHEGDRALDQMKAGEVLVVSWTLFAREAESFEKVRFSTAVLDEAHAIKNADTQRAKAAHRLQTDFLVALSGTPIENHVGELWSLFKAVMPALLGSEESFRKRFGAGQKEALEALSKLVRPFVLRRSKAAVAKELPARTDLEIVVPLSTEERALYDDVRLAAMTDLGDVTGESKRFDVLAALTRLRLTACHPRLVDEGWKGPASKLTRLLELLKDLSAANHRVLVFSQFTKHLALVTEALRVEGITFSYLDGQVPPAERARRVELFQTGGGGDVFLVSLKAGGTGLNLTAADYVIHLDPWWNPAVEDQASDRAHRIGQTRPVTVYRLIAEGTIEQQILSLHHDKRELVDALLAGADSAGKLSTAQLAELIRSS